MKFVDFEKKGNVVRLYLGDDSIKEWWGDDWDDAPYDCNAGTIYTEYALAYVEIAFSMDYSILEPCDGADNCRYSKEDMQKGKVPMFIIINNDDSESYGYPWNFYQEIGNKEAIKVYMGDNADTLKNLPGVQVAFKRKDSELNDFVTDVSPLISKDGSVWL